MGRRSVEMTIDPSKIKPAQIQKTLLLVNNFVVSSISFLNSFAESCEKKISTVSSKVTELEILLAVLEAKLNSISNIDNISSNNETNIPESIPNVPNNKPPPPPPQGNNINNSNSSNVEVPPPPPSESTALVAEGMVIAKDHPDYAPFFKMLKVGVPLPVVSNKVVAAGLDPTLLENPDVLIQGPA